MFKPPFTSLIVLLLLSGCKPSAIKPNKELNLLDLTGAAYYQILGKMSFSDGNDGGSGRVNWRSHNNLIIAELKAPLGSKSWQIIEFSDGAKIETNDGYTQFSESAQTLISQELGWQVPWVELKSWIKGAPSTQDDATLEVNDNGYELYENGWSIQYSKFKNFETGHLPMLIIARKDNYSIKVSIKTWNL